MFINPRRRLVLLLPLLLTGAVFAQDRTQGQARGRNVSLDVVVTPKSGQPVSGLQQPDFTVLDNKLPQTITSFQAVDGRQAAIEIVLVIDAVNTDFRLVASYERDQIDKFLRADGGHLAHPFALAWLTGSGMMVQEDFSIDGNSLSSAIDQFVAVDLLHSFRGDADPYQISLKGLQQLLAYEAPRPGRKIILWVSPGWHLDFDPHAKLDPKLLQRDRQQLFANIVSLSTQFVQSGVTLYSIDPSSGTAEARISRPFSWEDFVRGVSKLSQVKEEDLALQVLATQSGGIALSSNDLAVLLQKCITDLGAYYEISFNSPAGDQANEYHALQVRLTKPGSTARTRQGYYSQP